MRPRRQANRQDLDDIARSRMHSGWRWMSTDLVVAAIFMRDRPSSPGRRWIRRRSIFPGERLTLACVGLTPVLGGLRLMVAASDQRPPKFWRHPGFR